jgi:hypothetical protein
MRMSEQRACSATQFVQFVPDSSLFLDQQALHLVDRFGDGDRFFAGNLADHGVGSRIDDLDDGLAGILSFEKFSAAALAAAKSFNLPTASLSSLSVARRASGVAAGATVDTTGSGFSAASALHMRYRSRQQQ